MRLTETRRVQVVDTHTAGEPTRVVVAGGPDLGAGPISTRLATFRERFDAFRSAVVNEPRGSDVMVGALLCEPEDPTSAAGVIFFNNVGFLGMCGHGTIGVVVALAHRGKIGPGTHSFETPVGVVRVTLLDRNHVEIENVPSYRVAKQVSIEVPGERTFSGDVAWGGNWFFLVDTHGERIELSNVDRLVDLTWKMRAALSERGITGTDGAVIDHVELSAPGSSPENQSKNFVLCPGKAYDRSPCGTGTSAKLACLVADGKLRPGESWRQEGILGTVFEGRARIEGDRVIPSIRGAAFVNAEASLILDPLDPFALGIRP